MKIDGVPKCFKHPTFQRVWTGVLENAPSRIEQEEFVENLSFLEQLRVRFRRWAEMALESSHDGSLPHNFSIVEDMPGLYRGGFLKPEHLPNLEALGIKRVLSLCDLNFDREQSYMKKLEPSFLGSEIQHEKICFTREMVKKNEEVVRIAQKIWGEMQQENPLSTYIHCENGVARTGKIILALRIMNHADKADLSQEYDRFTSYGDLKLKAKRGRFMTETMDLWHLCNIAAAETRGETKIVHFWTEMHQIHKRLITALEESL